MGFTPIYKFNKYYISEVWKILLAFDYLLNVNKHKYLNQDILILLRIIGLIWYNSCLQSLRFS